MSYNHVIFGGRTLVDMRSDTVTPAQLMNGVTAHGADGSQVTGTAAISYDETTEIITLPEGFLELVLDDEE